MIAPFQNDDTLLADIARAKATLDVLSICRVGQGGFRRDWNEIFLLIDPLYDAWIKRERPWPTGWKGQIAFASLAAALLIFGYFGSTSFIYFQF